jgi:hypothetical protein
LTWSHSDGWGEVLSWPWSMQFGEGCCSRPVDRPVSSAHVFRANSDAYCVLAIAVWVKCDLSAHLRRNWHLGLTLPLTICGNTAVSHVTRLSCVHIQWHIQRQYLWTHFTYTNVVSYCQCTRTNTRLISNLTRRFLPYLPQHTQRTSSQSTWWIQMPRIDKAVVNTRDVVECLTLLHIREVPASNLGLVSGYSDRFSWLSSVPPGKCPNS